MIDKHDPAAAFEAEAIAAERRIADAIDDMRDMLHAANMRAAYAERLLAIERATSARLATALREHRCVDSPTVEAEIAEGGGDAE